MSRAIVGAEPIEVQAASQRPPTGVDARMVGTLRVPNGVLAQFDSALTVERREVCEVAGTEALCELPSAFLSVKDDVAPTENGGRKRTVPLPVSRS